MATSSGQWHASAGERGRPGKGVVRKLDADRPNPPGKWGALSTTGPLDGLLNRTSDIHKAPVNAPHVVSYADEGST